MMRLPPSSSWRSSENVKDFCECFDLPEAIENRLGHGISILPKHKDFKARMLSLMEGFFNVTIAMLQKNTTLDLSSLQRIEGDDEHDDMLMSIYVNCIKEIGTVFWVTNYGNEILDVLKPHLPQLQKPQPIVRGQNPTGSLDATTPATAMIAFHKAEKGYGGKLVSEIVWERICACYWAYSSLWHTSPYTSIVGPSGIGKTFSIKSIASSGFAYVVYASLDLDSKKESPYPKPQPVSAWLFNKVMARSKDSERAITTTKYECFTATNIINVKLCRRYGISPIEFFDMQIVENDVLYENFRSRAHFALCDIERSLYAQAEQHEQGAAPASVLRSDDEMDTSSVLGSNDENDEMDISSDRYYVQPPRRDFRSDEHPEQAFDYGEYIKRMLPEYEIKVEPEFKRIAKALRKRSSQHRQKIPEPTAGIPFILFALDEAGYLFKALNIPFNSLRRAWRHQHTVYREADESFFGVLLDTTAKYNMFNPPTGKDPSVRILGDGRDHFTPIYEIDTFDVLATEPRTVERLEPAIDVYKLFSFGRPLWASKLAFGHVGSVLVIARKLLYGPDSDHPIYGGSSVGKLSENALLSMLAFRVQFYVLWHHLAESLVSGHARMIYDINSDRTVLRTIQPSEPILAWIALDEMKRRNCKYKVIENFWNHCNLGSIDAGDIGEMVASLILLFSFDKSQTAKFPQPQLLMDFFQSLFGKAFAERGQEQRAKWTQGLGSLWDKGLVFFNHFGRMDGPLCEKVLRKAWSRGQALFTSPGTAYYDIVLPVALPDENKMSYVLIQVKNRKADRMTPGLRVQARVGMEHATESIRQKDADGKSSKTSDPASIFLFMALRVPGPSSVEFHVGVSAVTPATRSLLGGKEKKINAQVILAGGLDENLYPGVVNDYPGMLNEKEDGPKIYGVLNSLLEIKSHKRGEESDYHKHLRNGAD
jgi:hypothetical protein